MYTELFSGYSLDTILASRNLILVQRGLLTNTQFLYTRDIPIQNSHLQITRMSLFHTGMDHFRAVTEYFLKSNVSINYTGTIKHRFLILLTVKINVICKTFKKDHEKLKSFNSEQSQLMTEIFVEDCPVSRSEAMFTTNYIRAVILYAVGVHFQLVKVAEETQSPS